MSDTDDTDDLLLIPPDFFVLHSDTEDSVKPYGPYYKVVDSLITQVNKLEDRISSIETVSENSFMSSPPDYFGDNYNRRTNLMSGVHRINSWEDIPKEEEVYIGSTHSTPQKPRTRFKLNSLPSTPSTDRYVPIRPRISRDTSNIYGQGDRLYIPQPSNNTKHSPQSNVSNSEVRQGESTHTQKVQNCMLNEIDNFISNVKTIQRYNAAKNLSSQFDSFKLQENPTIITNESGNFQTASKTGLNLNDVDQMLHAMESQQRKIESRLKETEHELDVSRENAEVKEQFFKKKSWRHGENKSSVPDCGMGMLDILYDEHYKSSESYKPQVKENLVKRVKVSTLNSQEPSTSDLSTRNTESVYSDHSTSLSSSDSTQLTAYQNKNSDARRTAVNTSADSEKIHSNAMHILNMHKKLLSCNSTKNSSIENDSKKRSKVPHNSDKSSTYSFQNDLFDNKSLDSEPPTRNTLALLSLSELWNQNVTVNDARNPEHSKFLNKLQEERLRRQHCEQSIQQLQARTLELQERLAVAIQVDQAKDDAIVRIHKSWEEAASKIDSLNKEKSLLENQITELKAKTSFELSEAVKKVNHYEKESSKALNLAHTNQEKLVALEKHNDYLKAEIQSYQQNLKTLQDNYNAERDNYQQLSKILSQKEIELNENKNILSEARKEIAQSKRAVEICQTDLTAIKNSQTQLELQLGEKLEHIKTLEMEKAQLLAEIETHQKIERALQDDLNKQKDASEKNKIELRNFYQDQVEIVVRDKLREFQSQLEKAENSLQDEIRSRELAIAKAAAVHIQQVSEKHALEVHLLEEKHKEEVKLCKLQLSQAQQQINNLHSKMQQQQERRANIAQQLHKVMEAQWLEALKIINNGKSPVVSQDKGTNTIDQLNSLKSKSYNNVEEILLKDDPRGESMSSIIDDDSYHKILRPVHQVSLETPVTSKPQKNRQQLESELQKYVQMLLNKSPGNPTDEQNLKHNEKLKNPNQLDHCSDNLHGNQNHVDKLNPDGTKSSKVSVRDRSGKRPWK